MAAGSEQGEIIGYGEYSDAIHYVFQLYGLNYFKSFKYNIYCTTFFWPNLEYSQMRQPQNDKKGKKTRHTLGLKNEDGLGVLLN